MTPPLRQRLLNAWDMLRGWPMPQPPRPKDENERIIAGLRWALQAAERDARSNPDSHASLRAELERMAGINATLTADLDRTHKRFAEELLSWAKSSPPVVRDIKKIIAAHEQEPGAGPVTRGTHTLNGERIW